MRYWFDEKFTFRHKCVNKKLYSITLESMEEEKEGEVNVQEAEEEETINLSLHVLHGVELTMNNQTMKLVEYFKKRKLNVLIDSRSTHNFLGLVVAKQVGCTGQKIGEQKVLVANGDRMSCRAMIKGFIWTMQDTKFEANALLMPFKGCELIIGIVWLHAMESYNGVSGKR